MFFGGKSVTEGDAPPYETTAYRCATLRLAAAPDTILMAPLTIAVPCWMIGLGLSVVCNFTGVPGGAAWMLLVVVGHGVAVGIGAWEAHAMQIAMGWLRCPKPGERPTRGRPNRRMYPG